MEHNKTSNPYSPEYRARAVRLLFEHRDDYPIETAALAGISSQLGCSTDSLRTWSRQQQRDNGDRAGATSTEKARIKELVDCHGLISPP